MTVPESIRKALVGYTARVRGYPWNRDAWVKGFQGVPVLEAAIAAVPEADVERGATSRAVHERLAADDVVGAFVWMMAWGQGNAGFGPWRSRRILCATDWDRVDESVVDRLRAAVGPLVGASPAADPVQAATAAYLQLNNASVGGAPGCRIPNFGPAFFTKWIHFASARGERNPAGAAPVLDAILLRAVNETLPADETLSRGSTKDYERYFRLLQGWGAESGAGLTASQAEEAIFLDRTAPRQPRA